MDKEIKSELDELLAQGQLSKADYQRRLDALLRADELLLASGNQRGFSEGCEDRGGAPAAVVPPPLPGNSGELQQSDEQDQAGLWAKIRKTWDNLPFRKTRQILLLIYILMWIHKIPTDLIPFIFPGYMLGAACGLLAYVIGLLRKSGLAGPSMWGCILSGSLSFGILAIPVCWTFVVKMFRQKKTCTHMAYN